MRRLPQRATELVNEITQEGVVLAQNDDNILPVASGSKLNVFGWASTSPCYGGHGFRRSERRLPCHRPALPVCMMQASRPTTS
ncbi:MAG: hypothetical protein ACLVES_05915 [Faecalibacterium prausnitzii]